MTRHDKRMTPAETEPEQWGVFVDEVKLNAVSGPGADWWALWAARMERGTSRVIILDICIAGAWLHVACDDQEHAEWLHEHMVASGMHPRTVAVKTLAACRKAVRSRHGRYVEHEGGCAYCRLADKPGTGKTDVTGAAA